MLVEKLVGEYYRQWFFPQVYFVPQKRLQEKNVLITAIYILLSKIQLCFKLHALF